MFEFERFESRRFLAATVGAVITDDGTLLVTGTGGNEKIEVRQRSGQKTAKWQVEITPDHGKRIDYPAGFDGTLVKRIEVNAGAGKDSITLTTNADIPAVLNGEGGNDDIRASSGKVTLNGGAGDDVLSSMPRGSPHMTIPTITTTTVTNAVNFELTDVRGSLAPQSPAFTSPAKSSTVSTAKSSAASTSSVGTVTRLVIGGKGTGAYSFVGGSSSSGELSPIIIHSGTDTLRTLINATANHLNGGAGDDTIKSAGGEDSVSGGDGDDTFLAGSTGEKIRLNDDLPSISKSQKDGRETDSRVALFSVENIDSESASNKYTVRVSSL